MCSRQRSKTSRKCSERAPRASVAKRATRTERAGEAARERACRGVRGAKPLGKTMNIQQMMKQAQQMQERLQKQMAEMKVEATAGGGTVTVVMSGSKPLLSLKIDPEAVSKDDVEMLQDMILAAINDAQRKVDEALQQQMGGMMGGLKIPGL